MPEMERPPGVNPDEDVASQQMLKKMRETVSSYNPELSKKVEETGDVVKFILYHSLAREGGNPEIATLLQTLAYNLHDTLLVDAPLGKSGEQVITQSRNADAKAALLGASMVLDTGADRLGVPRQQPVENMRFLHRFLEMVQRRVGKLDAASGTSELRTRINPDQAAPTVKYTPKPK